MRGVRKIFREAIKDRTEGIIVNEIVTNKLRYADDTVLLATDKDDVQALFSVQKYKYLGWWVNEKWDLILYYIALSSAYYMDAH